MRWTLSCALGLLLLLVLTGSAAAASCVAPPGTAAIDQYCETVPGASGDRGSGDPPLTARVPSKTAATLRRSGPDGVALAQALGHSSPQGSKKPRHESATSGRTQATDPRAPSNNPLSAVGQAIGKGSTIGSGFVIALLAVTLVVVGWGWVAYRRRSQ